MPREREVVPFSPQVVTEMKWRGEHMCLMDDACFMCACTRTTAWVQSSITKLEVIAHLATAHVCVCILPNKKCHILLAFFNDWWHVYKNKIEEIHQTDSNIASIVLLQSFQKAIFIVLKQPRTVKHSDIHIINLKCCLVCHNAIQDFSILDQFPLSNLF